MDGSLFAMWICLSDAFVSIVGHRHAPDLLLVRARREGDLERVFPGADVRRTPAADYLFRAEIPRDQVASAIARELLRIGYPNFKDSVPDDALHAAYSQFWTAMVRVQNADRANKVAPARRGQAKPRRAAS
jgi:hypothetical protein